MTKKGWTVRDHLNVREKNVIAEQLVPHDKILFPSSKPLNQEGDFFFQFTCKSFPSLSSENLKGGIFDGSPDSTVDERQKIL